VTQGALFEAVSAEREAFKDGRLYLLVKEHPHYHNGFSGHVHAGAFLGYDEPFATVHVMSPPAGGEIRGYLRIEGMLYLRPQANPPEWDALDVEVSRQLGCPVVVKELAV
jgi:hypothetical protein